MGVVLGPEKMNDTCGKTMNTGMMDRGFTVFCCNIQLYSAGAPPATQVQCSQQMECTVISAETHLETGLSNLIKRLAVSEHTHLETG
jgi:hypothetical protein